MLLKIIFKSVFATITLYLWNRQNGLADVHYAALVLLIKESSVELHVKNAAIRIMAEYGIKAVFCFLNQFQKNIDFFVIWFVLQEFVPYDFD